MTLGLSGLLLVAGVMELTEPSGDKDAGPVIVYGPLCVLFIIMCITMLYREIRKLTQRYEFALDQTGITVHKEGKSHTLPWEDIEEVQVRELYDLPSTDPHHSQNWGVVLLPHPGEQTADRFGEAESYENGARSGWYILVRGEHLHAGRAEVERAVARFAGPRYTSPGR